MESCILAFSVAAFAELPLLNLSLGAELGGGYIRTHQTLVNNGFKIMPDSIEITLALIAHETKAIKRL